MAAYRFCRTDDIALLTDALNRCWSPCVPDQPPIDAVAFKRSIRDHQVWCSSCMVAFAGADPIGVLIGAKRPSGTLIHRIAVRPDHRRQGHGRHLLASLGAKLAILGPPRIVAEVPRTSAPACALFGASGYAEEALLTDYVLDPLPPAPRPGAANAPRAAADDRDGRFLIPVTIDDLAANGLLDGTPPACWERAVETLTARKDDIAGLAIASDERIEAYLLYVSRDADPVGSDARLATARDVEIVALRSFVDDGGVRVRQLLSRLRAYSGGTLRFPKVHPGEIAAACMEALGFRAEGGHLLYTATARPA